MREPAADRPDFPAGYAISQEPPEAGWESVVEKLGAARNYWVVTARPNGRPHAMPVWGLWLDDGFWFSTDPASTKGRNLAASPEVTVHLESGDDVVIVEGRAERIEERERLAPFADAYRDKYDFSFEPGPAFGVYAVRPRVAFTWNERSFQQAVTRWRWPG